MEAFGLINWIAVVVAALLGFGIGALWYSPKVFGTAWVAELGKPVEQLGSPAQAMTVTFLTTLAGAVAVAWFMAVIPMVGWMPGLKLGLFIGVMLVGANQISDGAYQGRSWKVRLIDAGYRTVMFAVIGVVIGAWR